MKIKNMTSSNGNKIENQFEIRDDNGNRFFQSYNTIIAKIDNNGGTFLDAEKWDYSNTTSKYRNLFLGEDTKATKKKIATGEYTLTNLN